MAIIPMWRRLIAPLAVAAILQAGLPVRPSRSSWRLGARGVALARPARDIGQSWKKESGGQSRADLRRWRRRRRGRHDPQMRIGQLPACRLTGVGLAQIAPEIQALQMPMMFGSDRSRLRPRSHGA